MDETVLVVDDEPDIAAMAVLVLELAGYATLCAHGGDEALELARLHHPHAVLLDVNMPGMTGVEVARDLRSHHATASIAIVFHTALPRATVRAFDVSFEEHLHKPLGSLDVVGGIERGLNRMGRPTTIS